jgi:hypothetical protein
MPSALIRKIFRGWDRGESFWDTNGMNENLRVIGDHLPLRIINLGGPRPTLGTVEGQCWIDPATGAYAVWSTGNNLQAASWHEYTAEQSLLAYCAATGDVWANTGSEWKNLTDTAADEVIATISSNAVSVYANDGSTILFKGLSA